jgi:ribose transport system substrate-binding protein
MELIMVDNRRDAKTALKNASALIRERVDVAEQFQSAGIPLIAIDVPHPGAILYGVDNYAVGLLAGHYLGNYVKQQWHGALDQILLLEISCAGPLVRMRTNGILAGLREVLPVSDQCRVIRLDGKGEFKTSLEQVRRHLRGSSSHRIAVGATNSTGCDREIPRIRAWAGRCADGPAGPGASRGRSCAAAAGCAPSQTHSPHRAFRTRPSTPRGRSPSRLAA